MINFWRRLVDLPRHLSKKEKTWALALLILLLVFGGIKTKNFIYNRLIVIPAVGGTYTEGLVGQPKILSPQSSTDINDRTILSLLFVGLTKTTADGRTQPMLAESWVISEDGRSYTFTLKENIRWHDGQPITASDVAETIRLITDPQTKSILKHDWEGVVVEVVDERTVTFHLDEVSSPFLAATNIPIIPFHIPTDELQKNLIGNGPYKYKDTDLDGEFINQVNLVSNKDWILGEPYISNICFRFFNSEDEMKRSYMARDIDSFFYVSDIDQSVLADDTLAGNLYTLPSQRHRILFLNTNRDGLKTTNERKKIINSDKLDNPTKLTLLTHTSLANHAKLLEQIAMWQKNDLEVEVIALESLGLIDRIDAHDYDLLFVDIDMRADLDLYPLWHSSQRGSGGYNFSQLDDAHTDRKLEEARNSTEFAKRQKITREVENHLKDLAVFKDLEQVNIYWRAADRILGIPPAEFVSDSTDRFFDINLWHIKTKHRTLKSVFGN